MTAVLRARARQAGGGQLQVGVPSWLCGWGRSAQPGLTLLEVHTLGRLPRSVSGATLSLSQEHGRREPQWLLASVVKFQSPGQDSGTEAPGLACT